MDDRPRSLPHDAERLAPTPLRSLGWLRQQVHDLRERIEHLASAWLCTRGIDDPRADIATWNLACYLALRAEDIRELQSALAEHRLSSLGRSESQVMATLNAILDLLDRACGTRGIRIMGTLPSEAAADAELLQRFPKTVLQMEPEDGHAPVIEISDGFPRSEGVGKGKKRVWHLAVDPEQVESLRNGQMLHFVDRVGRRRPLRITATGPAEETVADGA